MPREAKQRRKTAVMPPQHQAAIHPDHDTIGALAYKLWRKRGCPIGSPQEDWYEAERALGSRHEPENTAV